jgi:hypothetical protein
MASMTGWLMSMRRPDDLSIRSTGSWTWAWRASGRSARGVVPRDEYPAEVGLTLKQSE